ncbi:MAG: thioredoxin domain-containing protein, partial [Elusimicrobia bacterium]|nr:thioredoxin domain-containing protein [Elusimicrobiota bacterium]
MSALGPAGASESGDYWRRHAADAVHWNAWNERTLALARESDRPLFVSVGFLACHWCLVMERETFQDARVARLLNERFVPVLVDREERPDLDRRFMTAAAAAGWETGWPLNLWLTPGLDPFHSETYLPPESRDGRPGLRPLLEDVDRLWRERRADVLADAAGLKEALAVRDRELRLEKEHDPEVSTRAARALAASYDGAGFGPPPRVPRPALHDFFLYRRFRTGDRAALELSVRALRRMAEGAIFDAVDGGFHRYASDPEWRRPHYEKLLADNAALARAYLRAYAASGDPELAQVARATLDWMLAELALPGGGLAAGLAADSPPAPGAAPEEGAYYREGARGGRPRPPRDGQAVTASNGTALSALALGASLLKEPRWGNAAAGLGRFFETLLSTGAGRLTHRAPGGGPEAFPADYAAAIEGFLDLFEWDFETSRLDRAGAWGVRLEELVFRADGRCDSDEPAPCEEAAALSAFSRLHAATGDRRWKRAAAALLRKHAAVLRETPLSSPSL